MAIVAGIDYSLTSPSVCIHSGGEWHIDNCKFFYIVPKDKYLVVTDVVKGSLYQEWESLEQRFDNLARWTVKILTDEKVQSTCIEGYAFGAKGQVFNIGENGGVLKHQLWKGNIPFETTPPTVIKKLATGKGVAGKPAMWDSFIEETNLNLFNILGQEERKNWNPVSDMVDAYYLAKHQFQSLPKTSSTSS